MRLQDDIDFTTLTWVKAELDETLKQARHALEAYVEDPTDASQMRFCATYLHQVQGTLRMVELYGAAMVTEEMEHLASALLDNQIKDRDEVYQVLMRGIVQLPDYLERLQSGHKDIPIVLLPLLNELRGARGEKSLSEIVLFTPDLTRSLPASAKGPLASLPEQELRQVAEQLRSQFQVALLNWFRNIDADANVTRISQVCDKLVAIVAQEEARRLFWVAAGVMEALRAKAFEPNPQLKQTIGKVEREIKRLADAGEGSFRVDPPRELTRNLLYFVAHAPTEHGRIGELRQVFRLDTLLPTEAEIAHARGSMTGHNRALIDTVSVAIKEDLMRVKDALDLHLRTQNAQVDTLAPQVEVLDRVSDTLGMLGLGVARRVVQDQRTAVQQVANGERPADEATLLDIAGALLYVEASLDDQVQHLGGAGAEAEAARALPQAEARKVLEVLVKEAQANFAQAKQCFVGFIESSWDHGQLQDVPRLLDEVSGAMRILELSEPPQYLLALRRFTEAELLARRRVPNAQQMDTLADALASLEYYLEAVREHRTGRDKILEVTRTSLENLGYWPVPEIEDLPVAPAPVAKVETPKPVQPPKPAEPEPVAAPSAPSIPTPAPVVEAKTPAAPIPAPAPTPAPAMAAAAAAAQVGVPLVGFEGGTEEIDEEIREVFVEEVQEEINNLGELLPVWKADLQNLDHLKPLRRVFHTLKGSGRLVGALTLGEFSWKIENMLNRVLDKTIQPNADVLSLIEHTQEVLPKLLAALRGETGIYADIDGLKTVAEQLAAGESARYVPPAPTAAPAAAIEPEIVPTPEPEVVAEPEPIEAAAPETPVAAPEPEPESAALVNIDPVLFDILKAEVAGHLETIYAWLDAANAQPRPATDELLRSVHTMNGAFAMTDVPVITEVIGPLEAYIKRLLPLRAVPTAGGLAVIADSADAVRGIMVQLESAQPQFPNLDELVLRIRAERDALPETVGPSLPLHLDHEEPAELSEAVSPMAPEPVEDVAAAEPETIEFEGLTLDAVAQIPDGGAESEPFEPAGEASFPTFDTDSLDFDADALAAALAVEPPAREVEPAAGSSKVSADDLVAAFVMGEDADAIAPSERAEAAPETTPSEPEPAMEMFVPDETASPLEESVDLAADAQPEPAAATSDAEVFSFDQAEEPTVPVPELPETALDAALEAAFEISDESAAAEIVPDLAFDEEHIDLVRVADAGDDRAPEAAETVAAESAEAAAPPEEMTFEAELLALGELGLDSETLPELEIVEADEVDEPLVLQDDSLSLPDAAMEAEAEGADTTALDSMIAAYDATPSIDAQVTDEAAQAELAAQAAAAEAAAREADRLAAEAEAAREAELAAQAAAEAESAREAELAAQAAEAARVAEAEAQASAEAEAARAAELAAQEAAEAEAARTAAEAAEREARELAELEEQIAALEAAEAEAKRAAAQAALDQAEQDLAATEQDEVNAQQAAAEAPVLEAVPLMPDEPLADFAAEAAAEAAESATPVVPAAAAPARIATVADADPDPEGPLDLPDMDEDLLDIFLEEGGDILDHSDGLMARLRETPSDRETVVALQRDLHTLKGGARMAGIAPIGDLGHSMEYLLEAVADGKRDLTAQGVETLERCFDRLHSMVTRVGKRQALAMPTTLIERVEALGRGEVLAAYAPEAPAADAAPAVEAPMPAEAASSGAATETPEPAATAPQAAPTARAPAPVSEPMVDEDDISVRAPQEQIRIRADLLDRLVNYAGEVAIYRARLEQQLGLFRGSLGELDQTTARLREQLRRLEIETEAQIVARYQREAEISDSSFDPLELDRFSTQQQLTRALAESAADIVNLQNTLEDHTRQYETLLLQQSRVSSELQEGLMRTRMVPFDSLVPRLRRIIRQTAGELGKKAQLKVEGAQGEMDRNVLDRMTAPLEHMLRNALAHGMELPADRAAAGKPEEGTVKIAVRREGSEVVIAVSDDGRGLDRDAIRKKAIERGLMKPDAQLSDRDLYGFILETGFSTAQTVSKIAGRGVGMDVVHSEIRQLGGSLHIESERGKGSDFVVRLPFTLAVTQAVFVRHGETLFAVPISSVQGVARIDRAALEEQLAGGEPNFRYAGEDYSIYDLGLLLGQSHVRAEESLQVPLLLARSGDLRSAICVDHVIGSREIVVKPVGPQVSSIPGIFGATIMGDGRVIVILDVAPLVRRSAALRKLGDAMPPAPAPVEQRRIPLVMVVDDSITMRKVTGRVLERHNYEVITAKDGVDAIEKLQERIPDVMLLDIEMPRMDGYELATHMRNDGRLRGIPIIMITSRTGEKHRQRAFEIGVDRYLGKPYQENELMRNVQEILKVGRGGAG